MKETTSPTLLCFYLGEMASGWPHRGNEELLRNVLIPYTPIGIELWALKSMFRFGGGGGGFSFSFGCLANFMNSRAFESWQRTLLQLLMRLDMEKN